MPQKHIKAIDALEEAQKIAMAPFVFQTSVSLQKLGVLDYIFNKNKVGGTTIKEISKDLEVSEYGLGVLLEMAESSDIVYVNEEKKYELTKIGYFLAFNETAKVNMNFTNDVCFKGLYHLNDSIKTGKPSGLKELGKWDTIYEGLSQLPEEIKKSWFDFDHHYSDGAFEEALKVLFRNNPKQIYDIGGNTGKCALLCCNFNEDVNVKIYDLPGQLNVALSNAKKNNLDHRISGQEIDWLSDNPKIGKEADAIWMSQFLDCFSEDEIVKILSACVEGMDENTELLIMETFTDRQRFDNAKFILEATSLYFTVLANGNSKMYKAEVLIRLAEKAGLYIKEDIAIGEYHTILVCKKK
ncbi:methyltransferase [uncultured Maribacter sp.]|uniref:methyltransferase n=1 Tax=uncultured Maribacter sp. TaxID=431308 RepID=UPI00261FF63D|nr:methyltransferase [uncultured Maribacter sp.]